MAAGKTTTDSLSDSLPTIVGSSRVAREQEGDMMSLVRRETLGKGMGLTWHEVSYAKLTAQAVTESEKLDNPQQLSDTDFPLTPTVVGIQTLITDRVGERIVQHGASKLGGLAQNAIARKKNQDGITVLDGAATELGGAGTTLTYGLISAASTRIRSDTNEPGRGPIHAVLHGHQIKDIYDELSSPVGTYDISKGGVTAEVFRNGFVGMINATTIHENGDISIDDSNDAKGGVFATEGIVLVQGRSPRTEMRREPDIGGGATSMFHYDEYIYGEDTTQSHAWLYEIYTDATAPSS